MLSYSLGACRLHGWLRSSPGDGDVARNATSAPAHHARAYRQ